MVQGEKDPLSNMWTGPIYFDDKYWPSQEHAIVATKLDCATFMSKPEVRNLVLKCGNGFEAKKIGRDYSVSHKIARWHDVRRTVVFDVLISAAFTDAQFLTCLLDPMISDFRHVLPAGRRDPYWAYPGENIHGKLWLVHTARNRERDWDREQEEWVPIYYAVLFTLQRNQERERDRKVVQWVTDPFFRT